MSKVIVLAVFVTAVGGEMVFGMMIVCVISWLLLCLEVCRSMIRQ